MQNYLDAVTCADSFSVMQSLPADVIDLIVTDIPYGIGYKSHKQNYDTRGETTIKKDREEYFQAITGDHELPLTWLDEAFRVLKPNTAIYIFCHWSKWHLLFEKVSQVGFNIKNMIVLNKSNHGMGDLKGSYAPKHELLLFATKGRHRLLFPEKRLNDVWDVPVRFSGAKRWHPNEKPISWLRPCIQNSSRENDIVLDPFAGSGSTGICCRNLNRRFILIDIDPNYCEAAQTRLTNECSSCP